MEVRYLESAFGKNLVNIFPSKKSQVSLIKKSNRGVPKIAINEIEKNITMKKIGK